MARSHERRKRILEAGEVIFARDGYHEATVADIAKKAKVGEATIYQYFKNKEDLLVNIPVERTHEANLLLGQHLEGVTGAQNKIRKIIWFFFYYWESHPNFSAIIQLMWRVNKKYFHLDPQDIRHRLISRITDTIEEGQREGVFDPNLSVRLCRDLVLGLMEGILTRWLLRGSQWSLTDNAADVADIIIRAISNPVDAASHLEININEVNLYLGERGVKDEPEG